MTPLEQAHILSIREAFPDHAHPAVIPGFPGYYVDRAGSVYSMRRGFPHRLAQNPNHAGYWQVTLTDEDGKRSGQLVHRLVAMALVPIPTALEALGVDRLLVRHLDGDRTNARATNLAWGTHEDNAADLLLHRALAEVRNDPEGVVALFRRDGGAGSLAGQAALLLAEMGLCCPCCGERYVPEMNT